MKRMILLVLMMGLLAVVLAGCIPATPCPPCDPTPVATATATPMAIPEVRVDPRIYHFSAHGSEDLGPLNVQLGECGVGCAFRVVDLFITIDGVFDGAPDWAWHDENYETDYVNLSGSGGATHTFVVVRNADGTQKFNKMVWFGYPGYEEGQTTNAQGVANWFTNGVYFPDQGQTGPYCVQPLKGQKVCGGGLPFGNHVSLWVGYQEIDQTELQDEPMHLLNDH